MPSLDKWLKLPRTGVARQSLDERRRGVDVRERLEFLLVVLLLRERTGATELTLARYRYRCRSGD
jgi:hypothetical protein